MAIFHIKKKKQEMNLKNIFSSQLEVESNLCIVLGLEHLNLVCFMNGHKYWWEQCFDRDDFINREFSENFHINMRSCPVKKIDFVKGKFFICFLFFSFVFAF